MPSVLVLPASYPPKKLRGCPTQSLPNFMIPEFYIVNQMGGMFATKLILKRIIEQNWEKH